MMQDIGTNKQKKSYDFGFLKTLTDTGMLPQLVDKYHEHCQNRI